MARVKRTKSGAVLTAEVEEELANEAEAGTTSRISWRSRQNAGRGRRGSLTDVHRADASCPRQLASCG